MCVRECVRVCVCVSERGLGTTKGQSFDKLQPTPPVLAPLVHFREFFLMYNAYNTGLLCAVLCAQAMLAQQGLRHSRIVVDCIFRPRRRGGQSISKFID